ncbi:MAG: peptidoglycan-binding protein, partial [Enterococcus sp.]
MKSKKLVVGFTVLTFSALVLGACSPDNKDDSASSSSKTEQTTASSTTASTTAANADVKIADGKTANAEVPGAGTIVMRQLYTAPHGDKSFAVVNVTLDGDKILSARMDEFQYVEKGDDWTGVPNADAKLGENFPEGNILVAKEENSKAYSAMMKDHGGATQTWDESMTAITNFVKGKT